MEIYKPNLKKTHLDFMKWTVFSPHHTNHFVVSRRGVDEKNNEALFVGIVGCVVMRLGFFLVTWPL